MKARHFLEKLEHPRILGAIRDAEKRTSGQIRVYVSHRQQTDAVQAATLRFDKLGMRKTKDRNAVLIYLAPESRVFAVIGDSAVHEKCGDAFWKEITETMTAHLKADSATDAILHAVKKVGDLLARHFPPQPGATNELPNDVMTEK
jgi:uncharacterized membrane protein